MRTDQTPRAHLAEIEKKGLLRKLQEFPQAGARLTIGGRLYLNFSSNDYLGLAVHPHVIAASVSAARKYGAGAAASRLMTGSLPCHTQLEKRMAALKNYDDALFLGSGYMANAAIVTTAVGRGDYVLADRLSHASLLDAAILSRARILRFRHNDYEHLDTILKKIPPSRRRLVLTESVFSMDGDLAPLKEIAAVTSEHGALLLVDEAHATGVFGPLGAGLVTELQLEEYVHFSMATLGKALGSYGACITCTHDWKQLFVNQARQFIYSTAPPPSAAAAAVAALDLIASGRASGGELLANAAYFRDRLKEKGFHTGNSSSHIIPVLIGDNLAAMNISRKLFEQGIIAVAVRPPAVPAGTARLRFSLSLLHSRDDLSHTIDVLEKVADQEKGKLLRD